MDAKCCLFLGIILCLATILESRVIVPREPDEEIPLSINPLEDDNKLGIKSAVWGPPTGDIEYSDYSGIIDPAHRLPKNDYDDKPGIDDVEEDNQPGTNPERFPINAEQDKRPNENPKENNDIDKSDDENFINPHNVGDPDESDSNDKDFKSPPNEDNTVNEIDESEVWNIGPEESVEDDNNKEHKPEDEDIPDEERKEDESVEDDNNKEHKPEDEEIPDEDESVEDDNNKEFKPEDEEKPYEEESKDDSNDKEPEEEEKPDEEEEDKSTDDEKKEVDEGTVGHEDDKNGDESIPLEGERGFFSGGSIFDTPFFNLEQVKKYFSKLDRALGHVFRQTLDEALLLNGTYANTTEEEVDIGGKKYIVTKSVLKGADNNSMMYVEALSTKPKMDDSEVVQDIDIKNVTST